MGEFNSGEIHEFSVQARSNSFISHFLIDPHIMRNCSVSWSWCVRNGKFIHSDLYSSPNIVWVIKSRRMRWAGHVAHMEEGRGVHRVLVGKPEGKRPLGRPRCRWEDNIKMDLQEVGRGVRTGSSWLRIGTGGGHL